ncbi:hypothetical protein BDP27DRAFT_1450050 [Rhodocollybia butyracea]|uniref:Uncharacterized protein n=1 Tax=Rhodocollybia butyracea TaxID=206335 RepID=A0A9P5PPR2_9AGAR|nr:hypothetical protein BDP27DRAFT_1450050 [Rhodocollybia butyracea]
MTPEEVEEVTHIGQVLWGNTAQTILQSVLYGIYCSGVALSICLYSSNKCASRAKNASTFFLVGTFVLMILYIVSQSAAILTLIKYGLVVSLPGGIMSQAAAADLQPLLRLSQLITIWSRSIVSLIADAVIAWRASGVWVGNKAAKWTLVVLMLADIAVSLVDDIADSRLELSPNSNVSNSIVALDGIVFAVALSVNMVATCLIGFRAWTYHNSMRAISIRRKKSRVEGIFLLLVESGTAYALFQIINIIIRELDVKAADLSPIIYAGESVEQLNIYAAALNPVVIFILVQTQDMDEHSFWIPTLIQQLELSGTQSGLEGTSAETEQSGQANHLSPPMTE